MNQFDAVLWTYIWLIVLPIDNISPIFTNNQLFFSSIIANFSRLRIPSFILFLSLWKFLCLLFTNFSFGQGARTRSSSLPSAQLLSSYIYHATFWRTNEAFYRSAIIHPDRPKIVHFQSLSYVLPWNKAVRTRFFFAIFSVW